MSEQTLTQTWASFIDELIAIVNDMDKAIRLPIRDVIDYRARLISVYNKFPELLSDPLFDNLEAKLSDAEHTISAMSTYDINVAKLTAIETAYADSIAANDVQLINMFIEKVVKFTEGTVDIHIDLRNVLTQEVIDQSAGNPFIERVVGLLTQACCSSQYKMDMSSSARDMLAACVGLLKGAAISRKVIENLASSLSDEKMKTDTITCLKNEINNNIVHLSTIDKKIDPQLYDLTSAKIACMKAELWQILYGENDDVITLEELQVRLNRQKLECDVEMEAFAKQAEAARQEMSVKHQAQIADINSQFDLERKELKVLINRYQGEVMVKQDEIDRIVSLSNQQKMDIASILKEKEADFIQSLEKKSEDFRKVVAEMEQDFTQTLAGKQEEYQKLLSEQEAEFNQIITEKEEEFKKTLDDKAEEFQKLQDEQEQQSLKKLADQESKFNATISEKDAKLKVAADKIDELSDIIDKKDKQISCLHTTSQNITAELEKLQKDVMNHPDVTKTVDELKDQHASLECKLAEALEKIKRYESHGAECVDKLKTENKDLTAKSCSLAKENKRLQDELASAKRAIAQMTSNTSTAAITDLTAAKNKILVLEGTISVLKDGLATAKKKETELITDVDEWKQKYESLNNIHVQCENTISSLRQMNDRNVNLLQRLNTDDLFQNKSLQLQRVQLTKSMESIQRILNTYPKSSTDVVAAQKVIADARSILTDALRKKFNENTVLNKLQKDIDSMAEVIAKMKEEVVFYNEEISSALMMKFNT